MILTVTLNTSIDKAYFLESGLNLGHVVRAKNVINTAGGKGLNVTRAIMSCGEDALATGFVGGHNGAYLMDLLKEDKVNYDFVLVDGETRSSINILDDKYGATEILEPGCVVNPEKQAEFEEKFRKLANASDVVTISGSLPLGYENDYYYKLLQLTDKKVLLDTSVKYFKYAVKAKPFFVKPNKDEVEDILGIKITNIDEAIDASKHIHDMGIENACISLGSKGAVLTSSEGSFYGVGPDTKCVNSVGCGDTFVGAFAVQVARNQSSIECFKHALAASKANALSEATGKFDKLVYKDMLDKITIRKEN